jgi:RNA polymerase sigma factor (sigma-70 family)
MEEWNDTDLFVAIRQGNKDALSALFLRHYDSLKHYGLQIEYAPALVEESIQELFVYLFEAHHKLGDVKQVKAYLFTALRRRVLEKITKERRRKTLDRESLSAPDIQFSSEDFSFQTESQDKLRQGLAEVLNQLPWRQREAIYLRYYNSLSTREISEIMGVSKQTILNTLYQAMKKIRQNKQLKRLFGLATSCFLAFGQL